MGVTEVAAVEATAEAVEAAAGGAEARTAKHFGRHKARRAAW